MIEKDTDFVVDNGAARFLPLFQDMVENDILDLLDPHNKQLLLHTVVTGGQALQDTLHGLVPLIEHTNENTKIIVWLNAFFGKIEMQGKSFSAMNVYKKYKERIYGIVNMPKYNEDTFGNDLPLMLENK